jgi:ribosomal protein L11 methylase PrmA
MIDFEIEAPTESCGDLAGRIMALFPGREVTTEDGRVCFQLPVEDELDLGLSRLEESLQKFETARNLGRLDVWTRKSTGPETVEEPIRCGRFRIVRGEGPVGPEEGCVTLVIRSGGVFGSGGHPSTRLALQMIDEHFNPPPGAPATRGGKVLDAGTGSGILALAAARLGAGAVRAVDTSPEAVAAALDNLNRNPVTVPFEVAREEAGRVEGEFDLIAANLVASVLIRALGPLARRLTTDGVMIVSGFADSQTAPVVRAAAKAGLALKQSAVLGQWTALALNRVK